MALKEKAPFKKAFLNPLTLFILRHLFKHLLVQLIKLGSILEKTTKNKENFFPTNCSLPFLSFAQLIFIYLSICLPIAYSKSKQERKQKIKTYGQITQNLL